MDKKIVRYLTKMKVCSMATTVNNVPYCANCYYAFDEKTSLILFLSDEKTRHIKEALQNKNVAGTIYSNAKTIATLKGIQFTGKFIVPTEENKAKFYSIYYKKYPFAKLKPAPIFGILLDFVKMTDNSLGFGTKIIWENTL